MRKRDDKILMALPGDVRLADIEFEWELPKKKKTHRGHRTRGKGSRKRYQVKKFMRKQAFKKHLKELARIVAFDLLELKAMANDEAIERFREQQQREAKAYCEKLSAAFRAAVKKEAEAAA